MVKSRHLSAQKRRHVAQAFAWCTLNTYPDMKVDVLVPAHWETLSAVPHADTATSGSNATGRRKGAATTRGVATTNHLEVDTWGLVLRNPELRC